jgi:phospholipid/cholesterol/gamma-HCH transport system permease protein
MRTTEQIDALEIMGINTRSYLICAEDRWCIGSSSCLVVISAALAIWGGRHSRQYGWYNSNRNF